MPAVAYLCDAGVPMPRLKRSLEGLIAEFKAEGDPANVLDVLASCAAVYPEVEAYLKRWQAAHPDAEIRARIGVYLAS